MPQAVSAQPYHSPTRATFWQKLGPGGLESLLLALGSGVLLAGLPVVWRLRTVRREAATQPGEPGDVILVLGRQLQQDQPSPVFQARLAHGADLWRQGLAPRILVAGGFTATATRSEAEVGAAWLQQQGIPPETVITEDRSQHTLENLFNVREQVKANGWSKLILVSDPLHLARAKACATGLGLAVECAPAQACPPKPNSLAWWRRAWSEAFLLHWYHTGMLYSRLLRSRKQLARVT